MKFAFFAFIGLCAFTTPALCYDTHTDIELVLNTIFGQVNSLNKQVALVILQLTNLSETAIRQLEEDFIKAAINISDLINDFGDAAKACIKKLWPQLESAKTRLTTEIQSCSKEIVENGKPITSLLKRQFDVIDKSSKQFFNLVNECVDLNKGKVAECIFNKMGDLKEIINEVTVSTENKLRDVVWKTSNLSKDGNNCIRKALTKFEKVQNEVSHKIRECVSASIG